MEVIAGFIVGYLIGTKQGREGYEKLVDAWKSISQSEEFRGLLSSAISIGGAALQQGLDRTPGGQFATGAAEAIVGRARDVVGQRSRLHAVG
ncbi:MAG TPA: hypothetical protein VID47_00880 [Actinomycetota bacterium]|jgi:hypothetical protein